MGRDFSWGGGLEGQRKVRRASGDNCSPGERMKGGCWSDLECDRLLGACEKPLSSVQSLSCVGLFATP